MGGSEMLKNVAIGAVCLVVGGGAVQLLHAQTKPLAYGIAIIDIKDAEGYKKELTGVRERIGASGGKAIAAAGVSGSGEIVVPEGEKAPSRVVINEWPNLDAYKTWWKDVGQKDIKVLSQHATLHLYTVEGLSK
jgi:uncharacterized protein (DUF1330 family)